MADDRPLSVDTPGPLHGFAVEPGVILANRYEILEHIGQGGMGIVYKAHDRTLDETVAIKVLRALFDDPSLGQRFIAEIKLARRVTHKNVCRIHDYGETGSVRFISMQWVDGVELRQLIRAKGGLSPGDIYEVALQLLDGLEAIHHQGIIHRDLKASNVMVDRGGTALLMDFGLAKSWHGEAGLQLTASDQILGTPAYMSPEQARGEPLDPRSDIYSLGVIFFELFTGVLPIYAANVAAMIHKKQHESLPFDASAAARLPPSVTPVLRKALAGAAADRYGSTREFRAALVEARARTPVADADATIPLATRVLDLRNRAPVVPPHFTGPAAANVRGRRAAILAAALLGVLTLITIGVRYGLPLAQSPSGAPRPSPITTSVAPPVVSGPVRDSSREASRPAPSTEPARSNSSPPTTATRSPAPFALDKACDGGDASACMALAEAAEAAQAFARAADLYRKACDGKAAAACTAYGVLFNRGAGVTRDATQAAVYYERGCTLGDMAGCNNLGTVYQFGSIGFRDPAKAAGFYERACSNGQMDGCANLGLLLLDTTGVLSQDRARARDLLQKACSAGVTRACGRLK